MSSQPDIANPGAANIPYYTPAQNPPAGSALDLAKAPKLFKPLTIRGVTFQNRIMLSPLCQYSAVNGHHTDWHFTHLGGIIQRGPGLSFIEATAVTPEGRITPEDSGLWLDSQAEALKRIVDFAHSQGQKIGIQLAHAGRKASTVAPWLTGGVTATKVFDGWPDNVKAPSAVPYADNYPHPIAMTKADIEEFKAAWVAAVKRAVMVGFDVIEIHNAHGYLLHDFVSPVTNQRTDEYGGSFENRTRLTLEIVDLTRKTVPDTMPVFLRISATDCLERESFESWKIEDTVKLAAIIADRGVDLIDISTGGNHPAQYIKAGPSYQAPFAKDVKKAVGDKLLVSSVGTITEGKQANGLLEDGLDMVASGRWFQKNPGLVFSWADDLDIEVRMPNQISWAFRGRGKK